MTVRTIDSPAPPEIITVNDLPATGVVAETVPEFVEVGVGVGVAIGVAVVTEATADVDVRWAEAPE
jgi:hypothetical protein